VCLLLAMAFGLAFAVVVGHAATTVGLPVWAVVPLVVAILPLYQTFALPWITYLRAPRLTSRNIANVEAWLENLRLERGLPSFHVRIQEGRIANAFATAGLGAHLVVIGGGLLGRMSHPQLCALLAHEVAHVVKRHVPRLVLPLTILGTWLHVLCVISFANPLFDREGPLFVVAGAALAGAFAGLFIIALPGFFMRRMEFQADRLAAEMLGDGELLVDALTKLAELNKQPLDAKSWSHPTMQARIDAIRALAPKGVPS
ncbi:MAG: M48 family metalloprotease, partial [Gammaproteobacteria bacterium]|nr:M48 family metalloprotease [Gammaproteobacteria bacterium]